MAAGRCVRVEPAERYALPEGGEMERMPNKGGGGDTLPPLMYS